MEKCREIRNNYEKVCILSMQRVDNMGSLLQAYALKQILEKYVRSEVEFIDIVRIESDFVLLGDFTLDFSSENERSDLLGKLSKIDRYIFNRISVRKLVQKQKEEFEKFRHDFLKLQNKSEKYDLCVIGSDEVFNCLDAGWWGFTSQLFGNVQEADDVITYAASCGATSIKEVPSSVKKRIGECLKNLKAISVRDANTYEFIETITGKRAVENFDPVLVYDFSKEIERALMPISYDKYCIIYSYRNRINKKSDIKKIIKFCKNHGMIPIAVGSPQAWVSDYVVCNPFQCMKVFANSEFVITDTFHGAIFSFKYAKKYAIMYKDSNKNKIVDLVKRLNIQDHLLSSIDELDSVMEIKKDMKSTNELIGIGKDKTDNYLKDVFI